MSENLEDFMTVEEAALYLNKVTGHVCKLCRDGKLPGARKFGRGAWMIPRQSVIDYVPGLRGRVGVKAQERKELAKRLAERKKTTQSGQNQQDNLNLEDAALLLRMSPVKLRMLCGYGRIAGAFMSDDDEWYIPVSTVKTIRSAIIIEHVPPEDMTPNDEDFVSVEEAAKILGRSLRQVRQFCLNRRLEGARKSKLKKGEWLIPIKSVLAVKTSLARQLRLD